MTLQIKYKTGNYHTFIVLDVSWSKYYLYYYPVGTYESRKIDISDIEMFDVSRDQGGTYV